MHVLRLALDELLGLPQAARTAKFLYMCVLEDGVAIDIAVIQCRPPLVGRKQLAGGDISSGCPPNMA